MGGRTVLPSRVRVLPDGCMDLIRMDGRVMVAGPDTTASLSQHGTEPFVGLRFRPGALPRLLGVPAAELRDRRIALDERAPRFAAAQADRRGRRAGRHPGTAETTPWSLPTLEHVTSRLSAGPRPRTWPARSTGPAAPCSASAAPSTVTAPPRCGGSCGSVAQSRMVRAGRPFAAVAAEAGYADQPHLSREVRELSGVSLRALRAGQDGSGANRSTEVPSGSSTVA